MTAWTPAPSGVHTFGRFEIPTLTIGLDIAKNVFQVHGVGRGGKPVIQRKLRRADVLKFFSKPEPSLVGIEACHGSSLLGA
jgi:transposase